MKILLILFTFFCFRLETNQAKSVTYINPSLRTKSINQLARMIKKVQPELNEIARNRIAKNIFQAANKNKVDPLLMIAIIDTESNFAGSKVSSTGDLSMAQINTNVWNKEFSRLGRQKISDYRLKKDEVYALNKMAEILGILKIRHANKDVNWYARYHSHTKKHKIDYREKVELRLRMIASIF